MATARARPLEDWELPYLRAAGGRLRELRLAMGLSLCDVAWCAGFSHTYLYKIEMAQRRTRASTLRRLVAELHNADPDIVPDVEALVAELVALAGPTLAPESPREARIDRMRERRAKRYLKHVSRGQPMAEAWWRSKTRGWRDV